MAYSAAQLFGFAQFIIADGIVYAALVKAYLNEKQRTRREQASVPETGLLSSIPCKSTPVDSFRARILPEDLTVILPVLNGANTLRVTLNHLIASNVSTEIIVVSDGSTDESVSIAKSFPGVHVLEKDNSGKVDSIHIGTLAATGKWILIMDDDILVPANCVIYEPPVNYDALAFHVRPFPTGKLLCRLQDVEYAQAMHAKEALRRHGGVFCVSGAMGVFRRGLILEQISMHSKFHPGEDLQRSLLAGRSWYESEPIFLTDTPSSWSAVFRQRLRGWTAGMIHCLPLMVKATGQVKGPGNKIVAFTESCTVYADFSFLVALIFASRWTFFIYIWFVLRSVILLEIAGERSRLRDYFAVFLFPLYTAVQKTARCLGYLYFLLEHAFTAKPRFIFATPHRWKAHFAKNDFFIVAKKALGPASILHDQLKAIKQHKHVNGEQTL